MVETSKNVSWNSKNSKLKVIATTKGLACTYEIIHWIKQSFSDESKKVKLKLKQKLFLHSSCTYIRKLFQIS